MILFVSNAFLDRLNLIWEPALTGFLIGNRNFFFFTPDSIVPVKAVSQESIDTFLKERELGSRELLGCLAPLELSVPSFLHVVTGGDKDPDNWRAYMDLPDNQGFKRAAVVVQKGE